MKFDRNSNSSISNEERLLLGTLVKKYKDEYQYVKEVEMNRNKTKWYAKRKKHAPIKLTSGYGEGRKSKAPEALFNWFVDVRENLKGQLPKSIFKLKAKSLFAEWLKENPEHNEPTEQLQFSKQWLKQWEAKYGISLRKPN